MSSLSKVEQYVGESWLHIMSTPVGEVDGRRFGGSMRGLKQRSIRLAYTKISLGCRCLLC